MTDGTTLAAWLARYQASQVAELKNAPKQKDPWKQRADDLLYNIFPYTVARDLVTTGCFEPRCCDNVAVLFCDVVGSTGGSSLASLRARVRAP